MKTDQEIMEILAAYDLTGSYRKAADLVGCDHHTVRRYVQLRRAGTDPEVPARRTKLIDAFMPKIEELIDASHGRIGADQVHKKLVALGFTGTDRTTRRAVAAPRTPTGPDTAESTDPGSQNRVFGCSGTGAKGPGWGIGAPHCGARGWPGHGSEW